MYKQNSLKFFKYFKLPFVTERVWECVIRSRDLMVLNGTAPRRPLCSVGIFVFDQLAQVS